MRSGLGDICPLLHHPRVMIPLRAGHRVSDPAHLEVRHGEAVFRVAVKRAVQARRFTLRVSSATGGVVLTLPYRADIASAVDFARRHGDWIADRVAKIPRAVEIRPGALLPFRGVLHRIVHRPDMRGTVRIEKPDEGRPLLVVAGDREHLRRRLVDFLKRQAKKDLDKAVLKHTMALRVRATKITLKDTTSRWGSCSTAGRLNFSWRLIMAPPSVLDYLAGHEVAHLREMNHSDRFWRIVYRLCPQTDEAEDWLKRHGATLHRYR